MTGSVITDVQALEGATVTATHIPSGTNYATASRKDGAFSINGLRVGGPYTVTVQHVGYRPKVFTQLFITLGENLDVIAEMTDIHATELEGVTISAGVRKVTTEKSGASTVIDSRQLATLPTFSRSITDFTRLTPQSNGGTAFAGRSGYYNNIQVDGANLNNNFGLNTNPLPGGGAQPISLDAFDEVSVNIAPVDVRQSGFTGAGINAVTKSGTNQFHGTVYGFYRDQSFNGLRIGDVVLDRAAASKRRNYGTSLGGPIIKNKLFFFINAEFEDNSGSRVTNWVPTGASSVGNISTVPIDSLAKLANHLQNTYGYNAGVYDNYPSAKNSNYKYLAKVDWNINNYHKLTVRFSDMVSTEEPSSINGTSIIGGGGFNLTGSTATISTLPASRFSNRAMTFSNSVYGFERIVRTGAAELNSSFNNLSNKILFTISKVNDTRITNSTAFPFVDIFDSPNSTNNYLSFGYEPYSYNNDVINNVWSITDNLTYSAGKHTITGGISYEQQLVGNMFMPGAQSYYVFNSLNDFITNQSPIYYSYVYSMVPGKKDVYSAELRFGQLALYAQDEIRVNPNLKVTLGLRMERPVYIEKALENPAITALSLPDKNGNLKHYNGQWPTSRINFSPRVGARWDVLGNKSAIIRGSAGIFNGLAPFVWLTNMPSNSGMYQNSVSLRNSNTDEAKVLQTMRFNPDIDAYANQFPPVAGTSIPSNIALVDNNFKFPQVFRADLALDKILGNGFTFSLEGILTKPINDIFMRNANLKNPTGIVNGPDNRPRYISTAAPDRSIYPGINTAIIVENTNKGYSFASTAMLTKDFSKGFYGSVAYTYTNAKDVSNNSGSQAFSIWNSTATVGTTNNQELYPSGNAAKHRVVSLLSYRLEYLKHGATTVSLVYQGAPSGNVTYRINGDLNGDGNNQDLMFVPEKATDLIFEQYTATANGATYTFTPEQQAAALEQFIRNTPYLDNRRGKYTERNGAQSPWLHNLSARLMQDFFVKAGKQKHNLQFTADILGLPNLLNKYWGVRWNTTTTQPLAFRSYNADGVPVYRMQQANGQLYTKPYQRNYSSSGTWSLQLGLRYSF